MKYILDTNLYVDASRSTAGREQFRTTFAPLLPATYLSAVVAHELLRNSTQRQTLVSLREFLNPLERTGRIVTPTFDDWMEAASVMAAIDTRDKSWRSKLPELLNDILIALSARRVGAVVVTRNRTDFVLIRRHAAFALRVLD